MQPLPVFLSCPSILGQREEHSRRIVTEELLATGFEPKTVSRSTEPLADVYRLARACAGGVILGFEARPTPWNHLEAGVLFALGAPLLVLREEGVRAGVFDETVSSDWMHAMPLPEDGPEERFRLRHALKAWSVKVRERAGQALARPAAGGSY